MVRRIQPGGGFVEKDQAGLRGQRPRHFQQPLLPIGQRVGPRLRLADWMSSPQNPFFAKALVNRYWKHFFSRGIVDPEDDMRVTNPATNPELLNHLTRSFIESGFNVRELMRAICASRVLSSLSSV